MGNKILLVTGGGRGIGAACCRQAAQAGYDVAVNYTRDGLAAEMVAADLDQVRREHMAHGQLVNHAAE